MGARSTRCAVLGALVLFSCGGESRKTARDGAEPSFEVVDDMEDRADEPPDPAAFLSRFGIGNWFVTDGESSVDATIDSINPPREKSTKACHVAAARRVRGVDLLAQLNHPFNDPVPLDGFSGVAFWTKLQSGSGELIVALGVGPDYFDAASGPTPPPSIALAVSPEWQRVVLPFDHFGPVLRGVASIDFIAGEGGEAFDLWVDDLAFVCDGECPAE